MAFESPAPDHHAAPPGPQPERRAYTRRADDHGNLLRMVVSLLLAICGGLAVIFLFFAAMGAIDLGDAIVATVVAIVMGLVWFAGFFYRHRTDTGRMQRHDRERRGF